MIFRTAMAMGLPDGTVRAVCPEGSGITSFETSHPVRARAVGAALANPKTQEKRTAAAAEVRMMVRQQYVKLSKVEKARPWRN